MQKLIFTTLTKVTKFLKKKSKKKSSMSLFGRKLSLVPNLQIMQQNALILKLFSKMLMFLKLDFNKIESQVELNLSNIEFYAYFAIKFF